MKSPKLFADFVAELNNDLFSFFENNPEATNEDLAKMLNDINHEVKAGLNSHGDDGQNFDTRVFGMILDIVGNYLFMDNVRVCSKLLSEENQEQLNGILMNRIDISWAYFRQIIDSFPVARGVVANAANRKAEEGEATESSSADQSE